MVFVHSNCLVCDVQFTISSQDPQEQNVQQFLLNDSDNDNNKKKKNNSSSSSSSSSKKGNKLNNNQTHSIINQSQNSNSSSSPSSGSTKDKILRVFCKYFNVPFTHSNDGQWDSDIVNLSHPFCDKCKTILGRMCDLHEKLEAIQHNLSLMVNDLSNSIIKSVRRHHQMSSSVPPPPPLVMTGHGKDDQGALLLEQHNLRKQIREQIFTNFKPFQKETPLFSNNNNNNNNNGGNSSSNSSSSSSGKNVKTVTKFKSESPSASSLSLLISNQKKVHPSKSQQSSSSTLSNLITIPDLEKLSNKAGMSRKSNHNNSKHQKKLQQQAQVLGTEQEEIVVKVEPHSLDFDHSPLDQEEGDEEDDIEEIVEEEEEDEDEEEIEMNHFDHGEIYTTEYSSSNSHQFQYDYGQGHGQELKADMSNLGVSSLVQNNFQLMAGYSFPGQQQQQQLEAFHQNQLQTHQQQQGSSSQGMPSSSSSSGTGAVDLYPQHLSLKARNSCKCPNCTDPMAIERGDKKKGHICHYPNCGKVFRKPYNLKTHIKLHTGERPFACDQCPKAFKRSDELRRHTLTHTGEKRFQCPECPQKFMRSDHLAKHVKTHRKLSAQTGTLTQVGEALHFLL